MTNQTKERFRCSECGQFMAQRNVHPPEEKRECPNGYQGSHCLPDSRPEKAKARKAVR
jgi:hypothetical protein